MKSNLEIACFNLASAKIAANNGADRIEFASDYKVGGLTPDLDDFAELRNYTQKPIYILIREKAGNFIYSEAEIEKMRNDIEQFKKLGADGFVFGCLNEANEINLQHNKVLLKASSPLPSTFHRAFDEIENYQKAIDIIKDLGFKNILSSGGAKTAFLGLEQLQQMKLLAGNSLQIMPGGGIRSSNLGELKSKLLCTFYHSAGIIDGTETANADEIKSLKLIGDA